MANSSDLRGSGELVPDLARDGTVPDWDSLGIWRATVFRNPQDS